MEKMILAVCLFLIGMGPLAFSQPVKDLTAIPSKPKAQIEPVKTVTEAMPSVASESVPPVFNVSPAIEDTLPTVEKVKKEPEGAQKVEEIVYESNGYRIITRDGKIISAYYKGIKLRPDELAKEKEELKKIMDKQDQEWMKLRQEAAAAYSASVKEFSEKRMHEMLEQADRKVMESKELAELLARDAIKMNLAEGEQMKAINKQMAELLAKDATKMNLEEGEQMKLINKQMAELQNKLVELQTEKIKLDLENRQAILKRLSRAKSMPYTAGNFYPIGEIVEMLMDKKIIDNSAELSFELTNDAFIVNKVKQPAAIHEEFKKAFLKSPQDHVSYSVSKSSSHSDVSIKD